MSRFGVQCLMPTCYGFVTSSKEAINLTDVKQGVSSVSEVIKYGLPHFIGRRFVISFPGVFCFANQAIQSILIPLLDFN